jgi:hypothetical protein
MIIIKLIIAIIFKISFIANVDQSKENDLILLLFHQLISKYLWFMD